MLTTSSSIITSARRTTSSAASRRDGAKTSCPPLMPEPANQCVAVYLITRAGDGERDPYLRPEHRERISAGQVYQPQQPGHDIPRLFDQFGIKGAFDTPRIKGLPQFTITGFSTLGRRPRGNAQWQPPAAATPQPISPARSGNLLDNLSWIHGRHTIKFGADLQRVTDVRLRHQLRPAQLHLQRHL